MNVLEAVREALGGGDEHKAIKLALSEPGAVYRQVACENLLAALDPRRLLFTRKVNFKHLEHPPGSQAEADLRWIVWGEHWLNEAGSPNRRLYVSRKGTWSLHPKIWPSDFVTDWSAHWGWLAAPFTGEKAVREPISGTFCRRVEERECQRVSLGFVDPLTGSWNET